MFLHVLWHKNAIFLNRNLFWKLLIISFPKNQDIETYFSRFFTPRIRKSKKEIPQSSQLANFIFISIRPIDFETLGMSPRGFPRAVYEIL